MRRAVVLMVVSGAALIGGCILNGVPAGVPNTVYELAGQRFRVQTVVAGLEVPWSQAFTPDGAILFITERPGRLRAVDPKTGDTLLVETIDEVAPYVRGTERGLMGLAVSPSYDEDHLLYVSYTAFLDDGERVKNVVERWRYTGTAFERADATPLLDNLPGGFIHEGLPVKFGPDGKLYIAIGDATVADNAQRLDSRAGKFLRYNADGSIPADNPFADSPVWSLGHRNPQGFAFHPEQPEVLIATEHGPSGFEGQGIAQDEVNRILPGHNYGWPLVHGAETGDGFDAPLFESGSEAIAPSGATFCTGRRYPAWRNAFLFMTLRGASLFVVRLDENDPGQIADMQRGLEDEFGRLRNIIEGPDGYLYLTTSNRDGKGTPTDQDDRVLRLLPVD